MEKRKIYVGNLNPEITPSLLYSIFSKHGKIIKIEKKFPTFAFIEYESEQCVTGAVSHLNKSKILNKKVIVNRVRSDKSPRVTSKSNFSKYYTHFDNSDDSTQFFR
jgi:RNA recognition motif-containing protein